jgi:hypothetical protein
MASLFKCPSGSWKLEAGSWKAVVRKAGWPRGTRSFRIKPDAEDWARDARKTKLFAESTSTARQRTG